MGDLGDLLRVLLPVGCHAEAQSQSSMERAVSYSRIFKLQNSGLFWNAALFVGNCAYRHLPLSVVKTIAKGDTSGLSLSCCWRVCLFCSHVSSFYVKASLQRDGGSATAPRSVPSRGFNKQYWGNPAALPLRQRSYPAVKAEEITLVSVGMEEVWGAARCGWKWDRRKSIHPEQVPPSRLASCSKPPGVFWSPALSEVSAAQRLYCRDGLSSCSVISRAAGSLVLHFMCCPCLGISWHPPIELRAEILILHLKWNFRS